MYLRKFNFRNVSSEVQLPKVDFPHHIATGSGAIRRHLASPEPHAGFSLIEAMIAIAILVMVLASSLSLINQTVQRLAVPRDQVVAANLAAEGIEVIRNLRDSNWLRVPTTTWDNGLTSGGCTAAAAAGLGAGSCLGGACPFAANVSYASIGLSFLGSDQLYLESTGTYSHTTAGTPTKFSREIRINYCKDSDGIVYMRVEGFVNWVDRGTTKSFMAVDHLYDWLPGQ